MTGLSVGSTVAGCRIEAVAGRGGMGVVYRASQLALDRPVAVKVVAPQFAQDPAYRERFKRESQLAASLDHPNVIPVYEAGDLDGILYLIMRWVDGTDLHGLLAAEGRLASERAVPLLRPVASALAAAHRGGLVHRDVKPANVLIARGDHEEDEHIYLTDFGIARRAEGQGSLTRTGALVGTLDYTAPERIEGGRGTPASDIYSFGCMLYQALTGHVPYDRPTELARMHAHLSDPVPSAREENPAISERLDATIAKAMAKRPEDRFASASEVALALDRAFEQAQTTEAEFSARTERSERTTEDTRLAPAPTELASDETKLAETPTELAPAALARTPTPAPPSPEVAVPREPVATAVRPRSAPTLAQKPARSRGLVAAPVLLLGVVAAIVALVVSGGSKSDLKAARTVDLGGTPAQVISDQSGNLWASLPANGSLVRVDPSSGAATKVSVGGRPTAIANAAAGIWVTGSGYGPLALVNPENGGKLESVSVPGGTPTAIAVDGKDGSVWTANAAGDVTRVSAQGKVIGQAIPISPAPTDIGWGEGGLWVVNGEQLIRVGTTAQLMDSGVQPVSVTFNKGIWTGHANGDVTRFNPITTNVNATLSVSAPSAVDDVAATDPSTSVWAISKTARTVYEVHYASAPTVDGTLALTSTPISLAVSGGSAWVGTADGKLVEVTPAS